MNEDIWKGIEGQSLPKNLLNKLLNTSSIPHAFLFTGIDGIGKDFCALRFAQALVIRSNLPNKSTIIHQIENLSEPYYKYIIPLPRGKNETDDSGPVEKFSTEEIQLLRDELQKKINNPYYKIRIPKANQIKISSIRDIKKFVSLSYEDIPCRVIVISDAHLMNEEAQNALLKNLEEPPEGVVFILTTPYPGLLRETIRSRCWKINFHPLTDEEIKSVLINYFEVETETAALIAPFAMGSVTRALDLLEHDFNIILEKTIYVLRYSFAGRYHSALNEILPFIKEGETDSLKLLIQLIIIWLNDFQKIKSGFTSGLFYTKHQETLEKFYSKFQNIELNETVKNLERLNSLIANNVNLNLLALNLTYELSALISTRGK